MVRECIDLYEAQAAAGGVVLTMGSRDGSPIRADHDRLLQALSNLVGNALKFTPAGGTVSLHVDDDGDAVRISVVDSGPGIGREHIARVFEPFWQSSQADRRGRGLGLAIAKGIVEAHGGRIWLESELGRGTTVCFTVPKATEPS
jgi:signal transduction histidine kinase